MKKQPRSPVEALAQYVGSQPDQTHFCVAFSGGMDSHVLLHTVAQLLDGNNQARVRAVHINHGLNPDSDYWAQHCEFVCDSLGVPVVIKKVLVDENPEGPEAGARAARYAAFAEHLMPKEQLLLAQHADDQAETFLLQALRGSGPDGLASIPRKRTFAGGYMARPFLNCFRESLLDYAQKQSLSWIEDPSNADTRFDRNFLRQEVLPLLQQRWPSAAQTLSRSAARSAAASQTLLGLAQEDLDVVRIRGSNELSVSEVNVLPRERAFNVLRLWVRQAGLRMPRLQDLSEVMSSLIAARADSTGIVNVRDYEFRRHRDRLYLLEPHTDSGPYEYEWLPPFNNLYIAEIDMTLRASECREQGIELPESARVVVKNRAGGELIKLGEPAFHKAVKKLLQESAVPPWKRDAIPLLYVNERLAAVWKIAVAVDFRSVTEIA